ncbi:MAG: aryl-sulfate sulfotransferase [Calditrichaeota bacterium]|nr:aryl-sulfate sulfotransferase [Calditrichota bacterium]
MHTFPKAILTILLFSATTLADSYPGFTLFGPNNTTSTRLIDESGTLVHSWTSSRTGGYSQYLLDDGHILRTANHNNPTFNGGGGQGYVQEYDWNNTLVWEFLYSNSEHRAHHDIEPMPSGNVLMIAWEYRSSAQAVQAGLNRSAIIWPDHIVEVEPSGANGGNIVWEWHAWDHMIQDHDPTKDNYGVIADHPELLDINTYTGGGPGGGDWMHINGISYNEVLDQIVISSHTLDEFYVIDHSTTTAEAATHSGGNSGRGGDLLYRWGRPANYDAPGTQVFNVVHCSVWIPPGLPGAGHVLIFNNREGQGTSIVTEIELPQFTPGSGYPWTPGTAYEPASASWTFTAPWFYSNHLGSCQRLPNGNTLAAESTTGHIVEVDAAGTVQWEYTYSGELVRCLRYGMCYPGIGDLGICPPVDLSIAVVGSDVLLRWSPVESAVSYTVYRLNNSDDPLESGTLLSTIMTTTLTLTDEVNGQDTAYYVVISNR